MLFDLKPKYPFCGLLLSTHCIGGIWLNENGNMVYLCVRVVKQSELSWRLLYFLCPNVSPFQHILG